MPYYNDKVYISKQRKKNHKKEPRIRLREHSRKRAIAKNLEFDLHTYKDLPEVPKTCPALGIPLFVGDGVSCDNSPTLDRIDNDKGYIKGNIQVISMKANQAKSNLSFKEFQKLYHFYKEIEKKIT